MKKLLCGILCATAGAALATVESTVSTVDVIAVNSGLSNTVVAVPGLDLATGGQLAISNLVKTTNLTPGDRLMAFSNGSYEGWTLSSSKIWEKDAKKFTISGSGTNEVGTTDAALFTLPVGSGIWLSRQNSAVPFYVYGQHATEMTSTVNAETTALLGNPKTVDAAPTVSGSANGDQIVVPSAGIAKRYTFDGSKWTSWSGLVKETGLPTITAGTGFWYISKGSGNVTVSW